MDLFDQVLDYRAKNNLTQAQFGALIGVTRRTIIKVEMQQPIGKLTERKIILLLKGEM